MSSNSTFIASKNTILDILFEQYRGVRTMILLESLTDQVAFYHDVCLHGTDVITIAYDLMGLNYSSDEDFSKLYDGFYSIVHDDTISSKSELMARLEQYFNWLVEQQ